MKTIFVLFVLFVAGTAFARGRSAEYNIYDTLIACDNGRTYQWHGTVMYVDGLAARNKVSYDIHCSGDGSGCSLYENGFHTANCQTTSPPPPPPAPKHWDNYVKVCNGRLACHWESRQIN